jgi:hypothetical protein
LDGGAIINDPGKHHVNESGFELTGKAEIVRFDVHQDLCVKARP